MFTLFARSSLLLSILSLAAAQKISFDGRLPSGTSLTSLDSNNQFFQTKNVVGQNLTLSKVVQLPNIQPSIFDSNTVPLEVTIKYVRDRHEQETNIC